MFWYFLMLLLGVGGGLTARASDCSDMEVYDPAMAMCMPLAMKEMPMKMLMVSGNVFGGYTSESGPRGRDAGWSTSMVMVDAGSTVGDRQYLNVDLMLTAERWLIPDRGYPLLLQIGEENASGLPFIDAQHPHSSPVMGLTFSDTITLGEGKSALKLFFAPRGESTDGPVAFMHRATGAINPDAPLGHHIGQDVGHISSTVIGGSLKLGGTHLELSTFHGQEPKPANIDLPIGAPDSVALRVIQELSPSLTGMASVAFVSHPEPSDPDVPHVMRYSASIYHSIGLSETWQLSNSLIYGGISDYDHASFLSSFTEEFWLHSDRPNLWGRIEVLQRTPEELGIAAADPNSGEWVTAFTLGYTHYVARFEGATLGVGASVTKDLLPSGYKPAYGGDPWAGKIFLQLKGMKMWDL